MADIDISAVRELADIASRQIDHMDDIPERAAAHLMLAAHFVRTGKWPSDTDTAAAERRCQQAGVCPCKMVLRDGSGEWKRRFGLLVELDDLTPALAAELLAEGEIAVMGGATE